MSKSTSPELNLGVTLHSFTPEYCSFIWSLDDLFAMTAQLGGGVEIVGPSHQRGFPHLTHEFETTFRSAVDRYGLTPTSYGSYADPFMLPGRDLTAEELVAYTIPQLDSAARLGFPIVRVQHFTAEVMEQLLPHAEARNLVLGYELHVPLTLESERGQFLIDQVRSFNSPHLGLIPDAGIFARSISKRHQADGLTVGLSAAAIEEVVAAWDAQATLEDVLGILGNPPQDSPVRTWAGLIWDTFGHSDPAAMAAVAQHIVHVHAKFFTIEDGEEPDLRYADMIRSLQEIGYSGWISSEYEGDGTLDSFEVLSAHQQMIRRHAAAGLRRTA